MEFKHRTLANGLKIVAECNVDAHSTSLGFFVETGARDESDRLAGVSHFLEHMVFKGTPTRTADQVNREFDELGAHYNAFTSEENTVFYAAVLPEFQERSVDLLADILRPSLREEDFNTEKQVIIEEIRMYADQPPFGADDKIKKLHFGDHPLARSVLGTVASVTALSAHEMRNYFQERYSPQNITLAAAGRIDFDRLVTQAEALCGDWEPTQTQRETARAKPHAGFEVIQKETAVQQYIMQLSTAPAAKDADRFAAKLLSVVVGDDSGSRLYWEMVDPGWAEHASLGHYEYQGSGVFMTYMSCDPVHAQENLQRTLDVFRRTERQGITSEELAQAKNKIKSRIVLGSERPRNRLFSVGGNWISRGEYRSVQDDLHDIEAVSLDEVHAMLAKYPLSTNTTMAIGPLAALAEPR